jgi:Holliday junction resolvasome RuvABC DNA-binding subunit
MITQLKGRMVEKSPTEVVIDCNGIGYMVHIYGFRKHHFIHSLTGERGF